MPYFDSHAHYSYTKFNQTFHYLSYKDGRYTVLGGSRDGIFTAMKEAGIEGFVDPAIDMDSNYRILDLCEKNKGFAYPAIGVHPQHVCGLAWKRRKELPALARREGVVAVGETGLDYHRAGALRQKSAQKRWFKYQIKLAHKLGLPLILHIRQDDGDALKILSRYRKKLHGAVFHCFTGDALSAAKYRVFDFYFGIGGALLQNDERAHALQSAVERIPLDRILLETDAPYMPPDCTGENGAQPSRRVRNTSLVLPAIADEIARIKHTDSETVVRITETNAKKLFRIG